MSGGVKQENKASIAASLVENVRFFHGKLGIEERLGYRLRNISEGVALGNYAFIAAVHKICNIDLNNIK